MEQQIDEVQKAHARAYESAWIDFTQACANTVAPEATYQAWLAHFLIKRLGICHVAREVDFGAKHLGPDVAQYFPGSNLMVDIITLRQPIVNLPRRAALGPPGAPVGPQNPRSGIPRMKDFSVITELKVSGSVIGQLGTNTVLADFRKLTAILNAASKVYPLSALPIAYVGVFDNHRTRRFNFELLQRKVNDAGITSVHLLPGHRSV